MTRIVNRVPTLRKPQQWTDEQIRVADENLRAIIEALQPEQSIVRRRQSEPVLIGKTWKARRRDWGELAVMGVLCALILLLGTMLGLLIYSLIREIA